MPTKSIYHFFLCNAIFWFSSLLYVWFTVDSVTDSREKSCSDSPTSDTTEIMEFMAIINICWITFLERIFLVLVGWITAWKYIYAMNVFKLVLIKFIIVESNFFLLRDLMQLQRWIGWNMKSQRFHLQLKYFGEKTAFWVRK